MTVGILLVEEPSSRIIFHEEQEVDLILTRMMIRKVRTIEELDEALRTSKGSPGSESLYVHESLLEAARRWEEMRNHLLQSRLDGVTTTGQGPQRAP